MQSYDTPAGRDPELWRIARRRAKFKSQLFTYLWVNALLWAIWFFTDRSGQFTSHHGHQVPWPVWPTAFWGIAIVFQGLSTYGGFGKGDLTEREYQRLNRQ